MQAKSETIVYFDLETQNTFDDVGGRAHLDKLRLSVGVTFNTADDDFHRYTEANVADLITELENAGLVVGFNQLSFDFPVLRAYTSKDLGRLPTVDMLDHLHRRLGFRVGLDNLAAATLGASKSADGLQAVRWWRAGDMENLFAYCEKDVEVTRRLFEFGRQHHYVMYRDKRYKVQRVPVSW